MATIFSVIFIHFSFFWKIAPIINFCDVFMTSIKAPKSSNQNFLNSSNIL